MTDIDTNAGNEVRGRWSSNELAELLNVDAVLAYDENGAATGWVAFDPDDLRTAIYAFVDRAAEEGVW